MLLVPVLAGHFTGFAADTEARIGEKTHSGLRRWGGLFIEDSQHVLYVGALGIARFNRHRILL